MRAQEMWEWPGENGVHTWTGSTHISSIVVLLFFVDDMLTWIDELHPTAPNIISHHTTS
jgi:hypothetical protein